MNCDPPDRKSNLILSLFPGIGLLDRAFEECGFCVVRGPDLLWGGEVRSFSPPSGVFWGVIGGPPCQDFSGLNRATGSYGLEMLGEYRRIVMAARPEWWLMENVARVPDLKIEGYSWQRLDINQAWYSPVGRLRHIQFGSLSGRVLFFPRGSGRGHIPAVLASDHRSLIELKHLQGFPELDLPGMTIETQKAAIGNGVPREMGLVLALAVASAYDVTARCTNFVTWPPPKSVTHQADFCPGKSRFCPCGCCRPLTGRKSYYDASCRKRAQRKRDRSGTINRD